MSSPGTGGRARIADPTKLSCRFRPEWSDALPKRLVALFFSALALVATAIGAEAQPADPQLQTPAHAAIHRDLSTAPNRSRAPDLIGALVGGGVGATAGLLFVHEACDEDPCATSAYVLGAAGGAVALGGTGLLIGSRSRLEGQARKNAWVGAAIGGVVGAAGGIATVAAACEGDSCGFPGYASVATLGAGLLAGLGAVIGSRIGRGEEPVSDGSERARAEANAPPGLLIGLSRTHLLVGMVVQH